MIKQILMRAIATAAVFMTCRAVAEERKPIEVPAGDLTVGLEAFVRQSGVQLVYQSNDLEGIRTRGVSGTLTTEEALATLLRGTPLIVKTYSSGAVLILNPKVRATSTLIPEKLAQSSADLWLSQADSVQNGPTTPAEGLSQQSADNLDTLEDIIVTAQKREQRLQDVPIPISVIDTQALVDRNQVKISDYYSSVPGLSIAPEAQSALNIAIRGIANFGGVGGSPTTALVIDDASITAGGVYMPDLDPGDLQRIEVLRGPQGTLYGASSMGGLIRFVTADPSTQAITGRIEAGTCHFPA